jgi:hypothetical protein
MRRVKILVLVLVFSLFIFIPPARAFCGFYVAKADASLYNKASQVIIARDGKRTVLTMANDYQGNLKDFALVVPVPVVLKKEQVNVGEPQTLQRLDAFSAPRLVEYFDPNPCDAPRRERDIPAPSAIPQSMEKNSLADRSLGVTVEAKFTVGEYDIP